MNLCLLVLLSVNTAQGEVPDTRGPVQNAGMHVVANAEGVQAPGYTWQEPEALSSWSAKWIGPAAARASVASWLKLRDGLQYFESRDYFSLGTVLRIGRRRASRP